MLKDYGKRLEIIMIYNYLIHIPCYTIDNKIYMEKLAKIDFELHKKLLPETIKIRLIAPLVDYMILGSEEVEGDFLFEPLKYINSFSEGFRYYFHNKKLLEKLLKKGDILHSGGGGYPYFMSPQFVGSKVAYKKGLKSIFVMDCDLVGKLWEDQVKTSKNYLKKLFWSSFAFISECNYRKGINLATTVFLLGQGVYEKYSRFTKNPFRIYQPVVGKDQIITDNDFRKKIERVKKSNKINLFFLGRLVHEKGVDLAIESLKKTDQKLYEYRIIGSGVEEGKLGVEGDKNIVFLGKLKWGKELFLELDKEELFFISHRTGEMTRSVFDAMARGNGVVAIDNVAIRGLVEEAKNGRVLDGYEEVEKLLLELINNRDLLIEWMKNSREFVLKYNNESCILMRLEKIERDGFYEDISINPLFSNNNGFNN